MRYLKGDKNLKIILMNFQYFSYMLLLIFCFSCFDTSSSTNPGKNNIDKKVGVKSKPPGSFSDTIIIDFPAAVFYNPDSIQFEKIKAVTDTMVFESVLHDCFYQVRNSRRVLKQYYPHIKIIDVKNARYLLFEKTGSKIEYIDLDTKNDPCGIFIFDGNKSPRFVDMTNIDSELNFYFSD